MRPDMIVHADACVGNRQHDIVAGWKPQPRRQLRPDVLSGSRDIEPPAAGHRIARVDHQVHQHLVNLRGIGQHTFGLRIESLRQDDVLADQPAGQLDHFRHGSIELNGLLP
jgi:hypothetical protein